MDRLTVREVSTLADSMRMKKSRTQEENSEGSAKREKFLDRCCDVICSPIHLGV